MHTRKDVKNRMKPHSATKPLAPNAKWARCGGEAALSGERGDGPWAQMPNGKNGRQPLGSNAKWAQYGGEAALSGERGGSPWAQMPNGKNGRQPLGSNAKWERWW